MREFCSGQDDHQLDQVLMQIRERCREPNRAWRIELDGNASGLRVLFIIGEPGPTGPKRKGRTRKEPLDLPAEPAPESIVLSDETPEKITAQPAEVAS